MTRSARLLPALLLLLTAALCAQPAAAQYELAWDQCPGSFSAKTDKAFACQDDAAQPMKLVFAFTPPKSLPRFVGYRAWIEISSSASSLPDWWAMGIGDCREGSLRAALSPNGVLGSCQNPWAGGQGGGLWQFDRGNSPGRAVFQIAFARTTPSLVSSGSRYYGATLLLDAAHASGSDGSRCAGCTSEVCVAVTGIELAQEQDPSLGPQDDDAILVTRSSGSSVVTFNARNPGANPCGATNRTTTWGRIKTTYR